MNRGKLTLRINIVDQNVIKKMQFRPQLTVHDACSEIAKRLKDITPEIDPSKQMPKEYGLFLADEDPKKCFWLESGRSFEYYMLRDDDTLEYRNKLRILRVRMLDGTVKGVQIDDSQPIINLMVPICTKIGITNHDEYSLVREPCDDRTDQSSGSSGYASQTMTLSRKGGKEKDRPAGDAKMEQLRRKLRTDDDLNWVDQAKTLREQGIDDDETLLLRRKFFFSDQNIDSRDPVQLNLLYVQTRDAIVRGTHPVTIEQACQFAGLQCQIQFGDHIEGKHKPGFFELKEFLPRDYVKSKQIDRRVLAEHARHCGLSELDAKVKYVQLARSLSTYGVSFFLVKEKMVGKNRLVPRLIGVTKDSVLRLDEQTKQILESWPLTTVKRWAASPNSFTLDFGDYKQNYYSVQTTEGEQISQLIAGYIDIILRRKKAKDHFGIDGDEGSTMVEDSVAPYKATILQHQSAAKPTVPNVGSIAIPAVVRHPEQEPQPVYSGAVPETQITTIKGHVHIGQTAGLAGQQQPQQVQLQLSEPQRALLSTLDDSKDAVQRAEDVLDAPAVLPDMGPDEESQNWKQLQVDVKKQNVLSQLHAVNAATAQLVTLSAAPLPEQDTPQMGAAAASIAANLPELCKNVKLLATLKQDREHGDGLLDATRRLCKAVRDLLGAAEPLPAAPRMDLIQAASQVGETTRELLASIGGPREFDQETYDILMQIAKQVATAASALVVKAKDMANSLDDEQQDIKNLIYTSAKQTALASHQLIACAKVVAPSISNPVCAKQLLDSCAEVGKNVQNLVADCKPVRDTYAQGDLKAAAEQVSNALNQLIEQIRLLSGGQRAQNDPVNAILAANDRLFSSTGDGNEMVKQARLLARATTELISEIKGKVRQQPDESTKNRLLAAAKVLADATTSFIGAAQECASNPDDHGQQAALRTAAKQLQQVTSTASDALRNKMMQRLFTAARRCTDAATQNISAVHGAAGYFENEELLQAAGQLHDLIPSVIGSMLSAMENPNEQHLQQQMLQACERFVPASLQLSSLSKSTLTTVRNQSCALQLAGTSQTLNECALDLQSALRRAEDVGGATQLDGAIATINDLVRALDHGGSAAFRSSLILTGTEDANIQTQCKRVASAAAQLQAAVQSGDETSLNEATRSLCGALRELLQSVRGAAAQAKDPQVHSSLVASGREVFLKSIQLCEETKWALNVQSPQERNAQLASVSQELHQALGKCIYCLPGQREIDQCVRRVLEQSSRLQVNQLPATPSRSQAELHRELVSAAARHSEAGSAVMKNGSGDPAQLASSCKQFSDTYVQLCDAGIDFAAASGSISGQSALLSALDKLGQATSKLLIAAKQSSGGAATGNADLNAAARQVSDAINNLLNAAGSAGAPKMTNGISNGHVNGAVNGDISLAFDTRASLRDQCDAAIRRLHILRPLLDNVEQPISQQTYFECVEEITRQSSQVSQIAERIRTSAASASAQGGSTASAASASWPVTGHVQQLVSELSAMTETAVQAVYLVGAAQPSSVAGRTALFDLSALQQRGQSLERACEQLVAPGAGKEAIQIAANQIGQHTQYLCNALKTAAKRSGNEQCRLQLVQYGREIANTTAQLVHSVKKLDIDIGNEQRRQEVASTIPALSSAVRNLVAFASLPEFSAVPAKLSEQGRRLQQPLTSAGRRVLQNACELIAIVRDMQSSRLLDCGLELESSIRRLVDAIRDSSPGQRDCERAIEQLNACMRQLDTAQLQLINQTLTPIHANTLRGYREALGSAATELLERIQPVRLAGQCETENLGHAVNKLAAYFNPLVSAGIGCVSLGSISRMQTELLDQLKTVCECGLRLLYSVRQCAGNAKEAELHKEIGDASDNLRTGLNELLDDLQKACSADGQVNGFLDLIAKAQSRLQQQYQLDGGVQVHSGPQNTFSSVQAGIVQNAKELARLAQEMMIKCTSQPDQLVPLAASLTQKYNRLAADAGIAIGACSSSELVNRIRSTVSELGSGCNRLTRAAGQCQSDPVPANQREVSEAGRAVCEQVSFVLATLKSGARGTQACLEAASALQVLLADLNTTIMFATAGTLNAENEYDCASTSFPPHREHIIAIAKQLVEETKALVQAAANGTGDSSNNHQEALACTVQSAVRTLSELNETVKNGAASFGSQHSDAQVILLNSLRDVLESYVHMVDGTRKALDHSGGTEMALQNLKDCAKQLINRVMTLLKTVKKVEDEQVRGTRALEATIDAIMQELMALESGDVPKRKATAEELVNATKPVTLATTKAIAAGNSAKQEDVIVAANMGRKAISDLLVTVKQAAWSFEQHDERQKVLEAGRECGQQYKRLLEAVLSLVSRPCASSLSSSGERLRQDRLALVPMSKGIAYAITQLTAAAHRLKGSDWIDPADPTILAESELLKASNSIEAAANKLASLRPRRDSIRLQHEDMNFDEIIIDAAKSITAATQALMSAAKSAQRELNVLYGADSKPAYHGDSQWSAGLVSAAHHVAMATNSLVEAANALVTGHASEEKLISAAKQVASYTAALLVACQVKLGANSSSMNRLQSAGNAVKKATDELVRSAQKAIENADDEQEKSIVISKRKVPGIAQEINMREEVIKKERELIQVREKLNCFYKAKNQYRERRDDDDQDYSRDQQQQQYGHY